jgi:hypothetical protein
MSGPEHDFFAWQGAAVPIIGYRPLSIVSGQCKAHVSSESGQAGFAERDELISTMQLQGVFAAFSCGPVDPRLDKLIKLTA